MPELILWKNQEMGKLRRDMDRLFARLWDDFGMPLIPRAMRIAPSIDISETEGDLIIKAEIPGINPEDLDLTITEDRLTIKGEMKQELERGDENYHRIERHYGTFSRTLQLPYRVRAEDVRATYEKGILTIVMPKSMPRADRAFKIKIT